MGKGNSPKRKNTNKKSERKKEDSKTNIETDFGEFADDLKRAKVIGSPTTSDATGNSDGYIGKDHPRKASEDLSEAGAKPIDHAHLSDIKAGLIASFNTRMNQEKQLLQEEIDKAMQRMTDHVDKLTEMGSISGAKLLGLIEAKAAKPIFSEKVFEQRDSLLTESTKKGKEAHTVFNIFVAILVLIFLKMLYHDVYLRGHDFIDITLLYDLYDDLHVCWLYWAPSFLLSFSIVFIVKIVIALKLSRFVHIPLYLTLQFVTYFFPMYVSLAWTKSVFIGMVLTCEMARFSMKTHAYYREKLLHCTENEYKRFVPKFALKRGVTFEDLNMPKITCGSLYTEIKRFNYYLWIPTLVYRDEYVYRPKISKSNLIANYITFNLCFYYTFALIKGFVNPTFSNFFKGEANLEDLFTISVVTGILFLVLAFFGILHSWMNMFAELTRFGDRQFYTDWWNVSNYGAYYRKWNIIVHEWLYYYVYNDSVRFTLGKISSSGSKFLVFFISAIVHELIVISALKFFFPILLILFGGPGVIFMTMTRSNNRLLGIGFWFTLIFGNGMLIALYGLEYYTRQLPEYQAKIQEEGISSFFYPQCYDYFMRKYV